MHVKKVIFQLLNILFQKMQIYEQKIEKTPLHYASEWCETDVVKYLVSKGANKNAKVKDDRTPYDLAYKDKEIRNFLI